MRRPIRGDSSLALEEDLGDRILIVGGQHPTGTENPTRSVVRVGFSRLRDYLRPVDPARAVPACVPEVVPGDLGLGSSVWASSPY